MKQLLPFIHVAILLAAFTLNSCSDNSAKFKGTWEYSYSDDEQVEDYILWLDPKGKSVNQRGFKDVIGVIQSHLDCGGNDATNIAEIIEFDADGNSADIKYRHSETGEIFKAKLTLDPSGENLQWEFAGLYKTGANAPKEDNISPSEGPSYIEPSNTLLSKSSDSPNYK